MDIKSPKTFDEQIDLLHSRGISIEDRDFARTVLSNINYYVLTGYLLPYKKSNGNYQPTSFNTIFNQFRFDSALKNLVLSQIETAELSLKTKTAYHIAHNYRNVALVFDQDNRTTFFEGESFYVDIGRQRSLEDKLGANIHHNQHLDFVKHHIQKYNGRFPMWVIIELFTLGNLRHLYDNLPKQSQKEISRQYGVENFIMNSWIECLRKTRNSIAHQMRVYGVRNSYSPIIPRSEPLFHQTTHTIFDQIYLLRWFQFDQEHWQHFLDELEALVEKYDWCINRKALGFPGNWKEILSTKP